MDSTTTRSEALANLKSNLAPLAGPYGTIFVRGVDVQGPLAKPIADAHIKPLLEASNLDSLVEAFAQVQTTLMQLDIFKDVLISMTPDKLVTLQLIPVKKYQLKIGSNFNQHEGSGYIRGSITNKTGLGEQISLDLSTGTRTRNSHMLRALFPLPIHSLNQFKMEFLGYTSERLMDWSNSKADIAGLSMRMVKDHGFGSNSASFGLDAVLREFKSAKLIGSDQARNFAGESFKLSLFYTLKHDYRTMQPFFFPLPGPGRSYECKTELALNKSTHPFLKLSFGYQSAWEIINGITASFNSKAGILFGSNTHILDRFNLGGPLDIRGFRFNHLGPHDRGGTATGGELMYAMGLSVFTPLSTKYPNFKLHKFVNAGYLGMLANYRQCIQPSVSCGLGLCVSTPQARFELNFGLPLLSRELEFTQKGLQLGIGLEFL